MAKIYFLQHQAHGVVFEYPFAATPTDKQTEAVRKFCFQLHGFGHAKTPTEPYWMRVLEIDVVGDEVPDVPDRELSAVASPEKGAARAAARPSGVSGTGWVSDVITPDDVGTLDVSKLK